jgi:hypothetical protein
LLHHSNKVLKFFKTSSFLTIFQANENLKKILERKMEETTESANSSSSSSSSSEDLVKGLVQKYTQSSRPAPPPTSETPLTQTPVAPAPKPSLLPQFPIPSVPTQNFTDSPLHPILHWNCSISTNWFLVIAEHPLVKITCTVGPRGVTAAWKASPPPNIAVSLGLPEEEALHHVGPLKGSTFIPSPQPIEDNPALVQVLRRDRIVRILKIPFVISRINKF